ncbi:hypothetical protein MUP01_10815 [Candidatus Bathyarchaeota archaeon]|nr:hypothetical protein [Candidatus Bathyarchaeota archaeon]
MGGKAVLSTESKLQNAFGLFLSQESLCPRCRDSFGQFLIERNVCPSCYNKLQTIDGEKVCLSYNSDGETVSCGFSMRVFQFCGSIPYGQERPRVNSLKFGKAQGDTLGEKGTFYVLAHGPLGTLDLPIRSIHIRTLTQTNEHPKLKRMLSLGERLSRDWGFDKHEEERTIVFSNILGNMLRRVGGFLILNGLKFNMPKIVNGCFILSLREVAGETRLPAEWMEKLQNLHVPDSLLQSILMISRRVGEV